MGAPCEEVLQPATPTAGPWDLGSYLLHDLLQGTASGPHMHTEKEGGEKKTSPHWEWNLDSLGKKQRTLTPKPAADTNLLLLS